MAVASGWAGHVLARPLFADYVNAHIRTLKTACEVLCIRTSKLSHLKNFHRGNFTGKKVANVELGFSAISVYLMAFLTVTKRYVLQQSLCCLQHMQLNSYSESEITSLLL